MADSLIPTDPATASGGASRRRFGAFRAFLAGVVIGVAVAVIGGLMWIHRGGGQTIQPELLLENQRVRVVRWVLEPSQSTSPIQSNLDHISVIVRGSTIRDQDSNSGPKDQAPKTGDAIFEAASNRAHSLENIGKTAFEVVSIELK